MPTLLDPNPPVNWRSFTLDFCLDRVSVLRRSNLIHQALSATEWKQAGGIWFLGVVGWNDELYIAGEHVTQHASRTVGAFDDFSAISTPSVLDGSRLQTPAVRIETPPSVHPRINLHDGWPDCASETRNLVFCNLAPGTAEHLASLPARLFADAVLVGHHSELRAIAKTNKLKYRYLTRWETTICVRVC